MGQRRLGEIQQPHDLSRGTGSHLAFTQKRQPLGRVALV